MSITHICMHCGTDLARNRADFDRAYDFWVVICPQCATAAVRQPNALKRLWFRTLRLDIALSIMVVQLAIAFALLLLTRNVVLEIWRPLDSVDYAAIVFAYFTVAVVSGTWLTAGFSHHRRLYMWLGWFGFVLVTFLVYPPNVSQYGDPVMYIIAAPFLAATMLPFMIVAILGIPLGHGLLWLHGRFRSARWRYRRRRERRMRGAI